MKKLLAIVLVLALILGSTASVFAIPPDVVARPCQQAVDVLTKAGVVKGYEDGTYRPEATVTRAEMVKMLVVALGQEDRAKKSHTKFKDMNGHWADGYVAVATEMGLVKGYSDNTFRPTNIVTYNEAVTFIVRALGYTDAYITRDGGIYPDSYIAKARELDILGEVTINRAPANRGDVAMLIYQAWDKPIGLVSGGQWAPFEPEETMNSLTLAVLIAEWETEKAKAEAEAAAKAEAEAAEKNKN